MASATFTLRAVDETRAAFASVQNSLGKLNATSASVGKTLKTIMMGGLSKSLIKSLDAMSDKLDKIVTEGEDIGFGQSIEDALRLKAIIDGFFKLLLVIPAILAKVGIGIKDLVTGMSDAEIKAKAQELWAKRYKKEIEGSVDAMKNMQEEFDKTNSTSEEWADHLADAAFESFITSQNLFESGANLEKAYKAQEQGLKFLLEESGLRKKIREDTEKTFQELSDANRDRMKSEVELGRAQRGGISDAEKMNGLLWNRQGIEARIAEISPNGRTAIENATERIDLEKELAKVNRDMIPLIEEQRKFGMEFGSTIANSFEDAILSGNKLREVLRALGQDLLRLIFREQVTKPMASGLGNFFADLFKANGGPVAGGSPYVVGERGPELFVPNGSGSIVPNNRLSSGGGGGGSAVNVTYNIASGVSRAELAPLLENERKRIKAEIPDMVRRGGSYRAAFA